MSTDSNSKVDVEATKVEVTKVEEEKKKKFDDRLTDEEDDEVNMYMLEQELKQKLSKLYNFKYFFENKETVMVSRTEEHILVKLFFNAYETCQRQEIGQAIKKNHVKVHRTIYDRSIEAFRERQREEQIKGYLRECNGSVDDEIYGQKGHGYCQPCTKKQFLTHPLLVSRDAQKMENDYCTQLYFSVPEGEEKKSEFAALLPTFRELDKLQQAKKEKSDRLRRQYITKQLECDNKAILENLKFLACVEQNLLLKQSAVQDLKKLLEAAEKDLQLSVDEKEKLEHRNFDHVVQVRYNSVQLTRFSN
jgi:hypothetical protein